MKFKNSKNIIVCVLVSFYKMYSKINSDLKMLNWVNFSKTRDFSVLSYELVT